MSKLFLQFICLLGCWSWLGLVQAQPVEVSAATHSLNLKGHLSASAAQTVIATPQQALALYRGGQFEKLTGNLGRGYRSDAVWLAFDLVIKPGAPDHLVAEIWPGFLDEVNAYQVNSNDQIVWLGRAGDQVPRSEVRLLAYKPSFVMNLTLSSPVTVLLQIKTVSTQAAVVKLHRASDYPSVQATEGLVLGAIFVASLLMLVLAPGLYAVLRDPVHLLWLAYVLVTAGVWFLVDGLAWRYLDWSDLRQLNTVTGLFTLLSLSVGAVFMPHLFDFKSLHRSIYWGSLVWAGVIAGVGIPALLGGYPKIVGWTIYASLPMVTLIVVAIGWQMLRRHHESLWFGPMLVVYNLIGAYYLLTLLGLRPFSEFVFYGWQLAGFFNLLFLQVAMVGRGLQVQRRSAQERVGLMAQLTRQNQVLEAQVAARTQSLSHALLEVSQAEFEQRQLLSMASHEFRTPAAMIKASLDSLVFLKDEIPPEVDLRLVNMRAASARLVALSNSLIDQDRLHALTLHPRLERFDLCHLVHEVAGRYPLDAKLHLHLPNHPVTLNADSTLLSIALHNLIDNALRHGQRSVNEGNTAVCVTLLMQPGCLELQVADLGAGIADGDKARVFERFYTGFQQRTTAAPETSRLSSGLGLSIVQNIARVHGGRVWVCDNRPQGAVLVISLPCLESVT